MADIRRINGALQIAQSPAQKIGFYGLLNGVAQRSGASQAQVGGQASGTLTFSGTTTAAETVTIGTTVYTFKAALTGAAYEVLKGANQAASQANLAGAINASTTGGQGPGVTYGVGTVAHPSVTAAVSGSTVVVTAIVKGTIPNAIASTETMANGSWGAATLAGGTDGTLATLTALVNELQASVVALNLIKGSA